jgi:hypothetical protein
MYTFEEQKELKACDSERFSPAEFALKKRKTKENKR